MLGFSAHDRHGGRQCVPVLCQARLTTAIDDQHMTGGKFLNFTEKSLRRRRRDESEVVIERRFAYLRSDRRVFEDGLDFRGEDEPAILLVKVKRLNPGSIARQDQSLTIRIP